VIKGPYIVVLWLDMSKPESSVTANVTQLVNTKYTLCSMCAVLQSIE
jgi:hypothetical protein